LTMKEHVGKWLGDKSYTISTKENILKMDVWAKRPCTLAQLFVKNVLEVHDVSTAVKLEYICLNKTNWSYKTCAQVSNKYSKLSPYKMGCKTYFSYKNIWFLGFIQDSSSIPTGIQIWIFQRHRLGPRSTAMENFPIDDLPSKLT
jgi:hypothetical protein